MHGANMKFVYIQFVPRRKRDVSVRNPSQWKA